jgi:hypothetical protein
MQTEILELSQVARMLEVFYKKEKLDLDAFDMILHQLVMHSMFLD